MTYVITIFLILEQVAFAELALLAAIYNQPWISVFMCIMVLILIVNTKIKVRD